MTAAAHCHHKLIFAGEIYRSRNVGHARATGNQGRVTVDHAVEHSASAIIPVVARPDQVTVEVGRELSDSCVLKGFT
jgi:hypothetical protein